MTVAYLTVGFLAVAYVVLTMWRAARDARRRREIVRRALGYGDLYVTLLEIESLPETVEEKERAA